jgi:hypothetical protein
MDWVEETKAYKKYIKQNVYVYELQSLAIRLFTQFLETNPHCRNQGQAGIDYFLNYWIPRCKPYLSAYDAYQIAYTMEDMYGYALKNRMNHYEGGKQECVDFLGTSKEEYLRLYKARRALGRLIGEPVIHSDPMIIDLNAYILYRNNQRKKDRMSVREQGFFQIQEIAKEGLVSLKKIAHNQYYKVLLTPSVTSDMRKGDILHITLSKKIFFIYWEMVEVKGYYLEKVKKDMYKHTFV